MQPCQGLNYTMGARLAWDVRIVAMLPGTQPLHTDVKLSVAPG